MERERYRRERLGIWAENGGDNVIPAASWEACYDPAWPQTLELERVAIGVDVPPDHMSGVIAVAGFRKDTGDLCVELYDQRPGIDWIAPTLREILDARGRTPILLDGSSAATALGTDFRKRRVRPKLLNRKMYAQGCGQFLDAVVNTRLLHRGQRDLSRAVGQASRTDRETSLWIWKKTDATHNISPLCAATLAVRGALDQREGKSIKALKPSGQALVL